MTGVDERRSASRIGRTVSPTQTSTPSEPASYPRQRVLTGRPSGPRRHTDGLISDRWQSLSKVGAQFRIQCTRGDQPLSGMLAQDLYLLVR